jgi:hypothetical protein
MLALHQLEELVDLIKELNREANEKDQWTYIWGLVSILINRLMLILSGKHQLRPLFGGYGKLAGMGNLRWFFVITQLPA